MGSMEDVLLSFLYHFGVKNIVAVRITGERKVMSCRIANCTPRMGLR
jgi:hypothetical protein